MGSIPGVSGSVFLYPPHHLLDAHGPCWPLLIEYSIVLMAPWNDQLHIDISKSYTLSTRGH